MEFASSPFCSQWTFPAYRLNLALYLEPYFLKNLFHICVRLLSSPVSVASIITVLRPGVKRPERGVNHPPPS
jgi:hypothetical protein